MSSGKINRLEFNHYLNKLQNGEFFSFSRWGDGEWICVSGGKGQNCDGHSYFPEMSQCLRNALSNDLGYYKALFEPSNIQVSQNQHWLKPLLTKFGSKVNWVLADVWEYLVKDKGINELVSQLNSMNYIIVSEKCKRKLNINYKDFIEIPSQNCFLEKENIKNQMIAMTEKYKMPVFGLSASMASNVIIDELFPIIGDKCWMIDFGSIWDPFCKGLTRSYHRNYKIKSI